MILTRLVLCCGLLALAAQGVAQSPFSAADKPLREIYQHLHAHPELSLQEVETSAVLATEMSRLGFEVTRNVGDAWVKQYAASRTAAPDAGTGGHGVVAVLRNGRGPTLLIRADMDALPLAEKTGLSFASASRDAVWTGGQPGPVMHACGHDVHMTVWLGAARELVRRRKAWKGTLVMIAQPAEEVGLGARSMLADGLFTRFPRPDAALALHVHATLPAGSVGIAPGYIMANVDSVDITVKGRGGHGAYPHEAVDPIVIAARIVTTLQTLISREIAPQDAAVITVGSFHAGTKNAIIPDDARLELTVRSYSDATRRKLVEGIQRIARAEAAAAGLTEELMPAFVISTDGTPALRNDERVTARIRAVFEKTLGAANVHAIEPSMGGEDFARYGRTDPPVPILMFQLGAAPRDKWEAAQAPGGPPLPGLHSSQFAPDADTAIETGVRAMTAAAVELLK